jgi:hypothetical protein
MSVLFSADIHGLVAVQPRVAPRSVDELTDPDNFVSLSSIFEHVNLKSCLDYSLTNQWIEVEMNSCEFRSEKKNLQHHQHLSKVVRNLEAFKLKVVQEIVCSFDRPDVVVFLILFMGFRVDLTVWPH